MGGVKKLWLAPALFWKSDAKLREIYEKSNADFGVAW